MTSEKKTTFLHAFKASLPVMAGYVVLGAGFGMLFVDKGYSLFWVILMSVCVYAGSMQYVAVDLISGGASVIVTAAMTLMINIRHIFYGIGMLERYRGTGRFKPYLIFSLTDETFSQVCHTDLPNGVNFKRYCFYLSLLNQSYWVLGSALGGFIGTAFSFNTAGIEFAMTALFVTVFVEQWERTKQHLPAMTGIGVSAVSLLLFGADNFLIPAMIGIVIGLFLQRNIVNKGA